MATPIPVQTIRPLGFWEAATALSARQFLGASTMAILAEGTGPMTENIFRAAAKHLFERHVILQCRLSEGDPIPDFVHDVRFEDIPLTLQHAQSDAEVIAIWEQLLHEEIPDRRRLWEARFVPTAQGDQWRILLKVHHAVADGRSMSGMLDQMLCIAGCLCRGEEPHQTRVPLAPPAEQRLAELVDRKDWLATMQADVDTPPGSRWTYDHDAAIEQRRSRISQRTLPQAVAARLHTRCHERGTTVLGGLVAAMTRAQALHAGRPIDADIFIPIDMRRLFAEPPATKDLQMAAYCHRVILRGVSSEDDPWDLAHRLRRELETRLDPVYAPPHNFLPEDLAASDVASVDVDGAYTHGFCPTNVGRLPFTGDHPPLITDRIDMTAAIHFGGFPILVPLLLHKGVLRAMFTWTEPLMDRETAMRWIDDVWNGLASLAD